MPYDVAATESSKGNAINVPQHLLQVAEPRPAALNIDLGDVAGDDGLDPNPIRVKNIFICSGVVFWASSRMMNDAR